MFDSPFAIHNLIFVLVSLYYIGVVLSIIHLIFKTHYNLTERLLWMVVLWVIPLIGLIAYWIVWSKQKREY